MDFYGVVYGAVGGGVVGFIAMVAMGVGISYVKRLLRERDALREKQMETLDFQIRANAAKLETHVAADKSGEILTQLANLTAELRRNNDKTDRTLELAAAHESRLAAHDLYLKNLDDLGKEHIRNYHRGRR